MCAYTDRVAHMVEWKTAYQLEILIAELAGFDSRNIQVTPVGSNGDFRVEFVGTAAGVSASRAKVDVKTAITTMRARYRLKERS